MEIIIVGNDEMESAKDTAKSAGDGLNLKWKYFSQPVKNISLARNLAVAQAKGEYILFIDDDEIVSHEWLDNLYKTPIKYKADAVFGRVVSYFESAYGITGGEDTKLFSLLKKKGAKYINS